MKNCPSTDIEVRESVTEALKTSMGQLCESKQTFQRKYLPHSNKTLIARHRNRIGLNEEMTMDKESTARGHAHPYEGKRGDIVLSTMYD